MTLHRLMFAVPILLLPFAQQLSVDTGLTGLNLSNLLLLLLVGALFFGDRDPAHLAGRGFLTAPLLFLFAMLILGFVSAEWDDVSQVGEDTIRLKNALLYPMLYFVYRRCRQDMRGTKVLIVLVLIVSAVAGMEAIYQGIQFRLGHYDASQRASGPFGDVRMANRAGVFYAMFLPMFVAIALQSRHRKPARRAALVGAVIIVAAILFTYSRQSYLIALFSILILLIWRSIPAAVIASLLIAASVGLLPSSFVQRMQETHQVSASGAVGLDVSTSSRFEIWSGAMGMLRDHPAGVGLGRFAERIGNYTNYPGMDAHNGFILILAECGPLGVLAMLWLFWRLWLLSRWLRRSAGRTRPEARAFALGFTLTVVSTALGNVYGSPFFEALVMANFWILCGLMERYGTIKAHAASLVAVHGKPQVAPLPPWQRFPLAARALPGLAMVGRHAGMTRAGKSKLCTP